MSFNQNYYLTWENGELVTSDTMSAFSDGVAAQVLALTNGILPVILSGGIVSMNGVYADVTEGYYRVTNQTSGELDMLQHDIPGYFYAPAVTKLRVNNAQYVVARISLNTVSQYTTIVSGSIVVTDAPTAQDVVLYSSSYDGAGLTQISRGNDLQLIIPVINKSNQLIVNNKTTVELKISTNNQQTLILGIAQNADVILPNVSSGIYSIVNSSSSTIYIVPSGGYTILSKTQCLITPGSTMELTPISTTKNWIFL